MALRVRGNGLPAIAGRRTAPCCAAK